MKLFILAFFLMTQTYVFANFSCDEYFQARSIDDSLDAILKSSNESKKSPLFWIQALRELNGDEDSFPFANQARFGHFFNYENKLNPEYKRHLFFFLGYRGSHVDLPKTPPQNKNELANFLIHFGYAIELHLANRNSFSVPTSASESYLKHKKNIEQRRQNRLHRYERLIDSSETPRIQKSFLKIYLLYSLLKSSLKIQWLETEIRSRVYSSLPHNYAKDIKFVLTQYNRDIQILIKNLEMALNEELQSPPYQFLEPTYKNIFLNGILRLFLQPTLWQIHYWEPFKYSPLSSLNKNKILTTGIFKYLIDGGMNLARLSMITASLSVIIQSTTEVLLIDSLQYEISQNIMNHQKNRETLYQKQIALYDETIAEYELELQNTTNYDQRIKIQNDIETLKSLKQKATDEYFYQRLQETVKNS